MADIQRDPDARFGEDGLRPLRALRFYGVLRFELDPQTLAAIPRAQATYARRELRRMMRDEIESGRATPADIARAFGVSRQRIRQMLTDPD